ncbi:MAG: acetolactate synthase small subunit [Candidatus Omnitrophica bacterium]|nr:acetolactate synthase small subunit [Candidatus Omnitrophota bacterium]
MKHTISVLVENKPGVLARISGLFSARGFNIDSLAVGETNDPTMSRMTIVANAPDERILEQIKKQLNKLIDVISVVDLTRRDFFERELLLIKVQNPVESKSLSALIGKYAATVLSQEDTETIIEAVGTYARMNELVEALKGVGTVKELVRTGRIAIGC